MAKKLEKTESFSYLAKLTPIERENLKVSFAKLQEASNRNGLYVFVRLFQEHPHYKKIFPKFRYLTDEAMSNSTELRNHGNLFMKTLKEVIENLDDDRRLGEVLKTVAMTHQIKGVQKFHIDNMVPFVLASLEMSGQRNPETEEAWTCLFSVIAAMIEEFKNAS